MVAAIVYMNTGAGVVPMIIPHASMCSGPRITLSYGLEVMAGRIPSSTSRTAKCSARLIMDAL